MPTDGRAMSGGSVTRASPSGFRVRSNLRKFATEGQAAKNLPSWQGAAGWHVAPRTRQIFRKNCGAPADLLGRVRRIRMPTLTQFVRFVEAYGFRIMLCELLDGEPSSA